VQHHFGDWGVPVGMIIQYLFEHPEEEWWRAAAAHAPEPWPLTDTYQRAQAAFKPKLSSFADRARGKVAALQAGDPGTTAVWKDIRVQSLAVFHDVYRRLGAELRPEHDAGESFYKSMVPDVLAELSAAGITTERDGAHVVESKELGDFLVRKTDGRYGYAATELAALRYRVRQLRANYLLYVTDSRQRLHFDRLFDTARWADWLVDVEAHHVPFRPVTDGAGKVLKSRTGNSLPLDRLLDDVGRRVVAQRGEDGATVDPDTAEQVGLAMIKFGALARGHVFEPGPLFDAGSAGCYVLYAYVRARHVLTEAVGGPDPGIDPALPLTPEERTLALCLDGVDDVLTSVHRRRDPSLLCDYLTSLSRAFTSFYEHCWVLPADPPIRGNRLALCRLTVQVMRCGLDLLGLTAPDRM
jgi:arginyl-tRNA synthetase